MTVIAVLLDKPLELYREKVGAIESNLKKKIRRKSPDFLF
jgi:hypothetical protein